MEKNAVSLRKGVWSKEEDILLTKCIEKYGEGRWHLVPLRAGVNRCRKSCRLRWLNYLSPNIKRGSFAGDEIDLLVRLHKLLGNRWSLIAGRIPGRTANDVKNFWNTYMADKKKPSPPPPPATDGETIVTKSNNMIIKPQPSRKLQAPPCPLELIISPDTDTNKQLDEKNKSLDDQLMVPAQSEEGGDECMRWWSSLLDINENENMSGGPFLFPEDEPRPIPNTISHDHDANIIDGLSDIELLDADLWDLLSMDNN